jgi:hypothetical protein
MYHHRLLLAIAALTVTMSVVACGGGSSTAVPPAQSTASIPQQTFVGVSTTASTVANVSAGNTAVAFAFAPATSGSGSLTLSGSATQPAGTPALSFARSSAETVGTQAASGTVALAFVTLIASGTDTFSAYPTVTFTLPAGAATAGQTYDLAALSPGSTHWTEPLAGPGVLASANGASTVTFAPQTFTSATLALPYQFTGGAAYQFALYQVPTPAATPTPSPLASAAPTVAPSAGASPTPTGTPTATPSVVFTPAACPTGGSAPAICNISPTSGPVGSTVLINGYNFATPITITFGGGVAGTGSFTATQITATVPAGASSGSITVTSNGQTLASPVFTVTH